MLVKLTIITSLHSMVEDPTPNSDARFQVTLVFVEMKSPTKQQRKH